MTRMKQTAIGAALVASLLLAAPVQAAQCVDQTISSAARIQELKILLMNGKKTISGKKQEHGCSSRLVGY